MPRCCVCDKIGGCKRFRKWYALHSVEYTAFVIKQVKNHPEKYELRSSIMSTKRVTPRMVVMIDEKTSECEVMEYEKLKNLSEAEVKKLSGKKILDLGTKEHEVIVTVKLNTKVWNGKISQKKVVGK